MTISTKLSDLFLLLIILLLSFSTYYSISYLREEVYNLSTRVKALETASEKTLEITVERAWDRKNARYIYKLDNVKEVN